MAERTLASAVEEAAQHAAATAGFTFLDGGVPGFTAGAPEVFVSYPALERASSQRAGALAALGLQKGDRVALILPGYDDFVSCFLGALRAGIIPVPIYPPLGIGEVAAYLENSSQILVRCGARALITAGTIKRLLGTLPERCPALREVISIDELRALDRPLRPVAIAPDDVAFLQFTSGSTSQPKGVVVTHANLLANIRCIMELGLRVDAGDLGVSWLPLFHDMGLIGFVLAPIVHRSSVVFLSPLTFLKRPLTWFQAITRYRGTVSYAPNFAYALCCKRIKDAELAGIDLGSWRVAGCGAEPIRAETLEAFAARFAPVGFAAESFLPAYGMAESSLAVSFSPAGRGVKTVHVDARLLEERGEVRRVAAGGERAVSQVSCGAPFAEHELAPFAVDDAASAAPLGEGRVGELRLRGPSVMRGYWEDEGTTRAAFAGGYLRTGDLGFLLDGEIYVCGRIKELIIVNGRNYYPQDLEWAASQVAGVRPGNAIAFGTRVQAGAARAAGSASEVSATERVVLVFEVQKPELMARAEELRGEVMAQLRGSLGLGLDDAVALPPGSLPKTSSGKLQRTRLRALYEAGELAKLAVAAQQRRAPSKLAAAAEVARSEWSYWKRAALRRLRGAKRLG